MNSEQSSSLADLSLNALCFIYLRIVLYLCDDVYNL